MDESNSLVHEYFVLKCKILTVSCLQTPLQFIFKFNITVCLCLKILCMHFQYLSPDRIRVTYMHLLNIHQGSSYEHKRLNPHFGFHVKALNIDYNNNSK